MPGAVTRTPAKRALADATSNGANVQASPRSSKKLKMEDEKKLRAPPVKTANGSFNSSQPAPSQFEETLEKMTQEIEAEEGVLNGGRASVKLFGVTEVCRACKNLSFDLTPAHRTDTQYSST
jgi:DNA polymerase delta subunit 1